MDFSLIVIYYIWGRQVGFSSVPIAYQLCRERNTLSILTVEILAHFDQPPTSQLAGARLRNLQLLRDFIVFAPSHVAEIGSSGLTGVLLPNVLESVQSDSTVAYHHIL